MSRRRRGVALNGWVIIDKPAGITSAHVVGKVRRLTNAAKAGHAGTLDPLATGILPLALGEATKTVSFVQDGAKTYRFTVRWGEERSTDDAEGAVPQEVRIVAPSLKGFMLARSLSKRASDFDRARSALSVIRCDRQEAPKD